jgi:hypothetical protein
MPASASRSVYLIETYCTPRSLWWTRPPPRTGLRSFVQGLLQCVQHKAGVRRARGTPPDDAPGKGVDE